MKHLFLTVALFISISIPLSAQSNKKTFTNENPHQVLTLKENSYFETNAKNIILFISDGMGVDQVFSALTANRGAPNMIQMPFTGFSQTQNVNSYITDSAAGATALSTGQRTYNGAIGMDIDTLAIPTILEISKAQGYATGLVSSPSITHATPASFIAHQPSRDLQEEIAADFIGSDINIFIGGGQNFLFYFMFF